MNREILFKAKRKDNDKWVEGYLFDDGMPKPKRYFIGGIIVKPYEGTACDKWNVVGIDFCEINQDTICQFTGLTDKEIWENDILRNKKGDIGVVQWFEEHTAFMIWNKTKNCVCYLSENDFSKIEVIGNIFDNAELLEA